MIKKFQEYISEGLWKDGVDRAKSGEVRREEKDQIFYRDSVFPVKGLKDYFFQFGYIGKDPSFNIYKKPYEGVACTFFGVEKDKVNGYKYYVKNPEDFGCAGDLWRDKEFIAFVKSPEFVEALNQSIKDVPNRYFVKGYKPKPIAESLWKSGINRAKSGEERLENRIDSNIYELEPVDLNPNLDFYVASDLLFIDGEFQKPNVYWKSHNILNLIKKKGWRIMNKSELESLEKFKYNIKKTKTGRRVLFRYVFLDDSLEDEYVIDIGQSKSSENKVHMHHTSDRILLTLGDDDIDGSVLFVNNKIDVKTGTVDMDSNGYPSSVWLVKDKNPVNESLWKSSIERAKSGNERIEKGIKTKFGNYCTIQDKELMENTISNLFKYYLGKPQYLMRIVWYREGVQIFDKKVKDKLKEGWPTAFTIDEKGEVALDAVDAETYSEHFEEINEVDYHNIVKCIAEVFSTIRFNRNKEDNKYYNMIVVDKSEGSEKIWSMDNRENYRNLIKDKFGIEPIIMSSKVMLPITYENTIAYHKVVELTKDFLSKL